MRQLFLAVVWLVLWAGQAVAAPSFCTLTGSLLLPNGDPCANCNVTIRVPRAQEVGGVTFPVKTSSYTTNTNGTLPAGVQAARTLVVEITIDKTPPITVQIPDTSSADLSTLLLPPITLPTSTNINSLSSTLTVSKGGTGGPPAGDDQVLVSNSTSSATWKTLTDCNAAGEAVTYDTATNTWGCATGLGGGGSGDVTDVGDCAGPACFNGTSGNSIQFEGSTADAFETTLTVTDPTADRTATLPNFSGTLAMERVYDVRAYGALCDDSTDDAAAIQAAIDAAETTGSGNKQGGVVEFPVGICKINSGLTMNAAGITLRGQGAADSSNGTILSVNFGTGTAITLQSDCDFCGVERMQLNGRTTTTDLVLIDGTDAGNDFVRDVITTNYCTAIKNVLRVDRSDLFGPVAGASCRGVSAVDNAVYLNRVTGNWANDIEGMIVIEQTVSGQVDTVVISDTEIAQGGGAGAALKIIGTSSTNPPRWIQVSNSLFEGKTTGASTGDYAIEIGNAREFKCTNCYAHGGYNTVRVSGGPGPIRFVNSEIGDARRDALYHDADVPTELIATTVSDGSQETTNTYSGIHLTTNSRQFTMIGGRASDDLFFSGSGQKYGILIDAGADEYRFDNVGCEGNDTACASGLSPAAAQAAFTDAVALADSDWSNYVTVQAPSLSANWALTLPANDGSSGQFLQTDGSGVTTWATPSGSGNVSNTGTPANNQIAVWTDATTIEGDPKLTLSGSSLTLGDSAVDAGFTLATGLTGGTDPQIDFTNGQVDCANCRFTLTGGTKVIPDAGGGGVATRVPYWSDTDTLTDEAAFAYDSSTNTLTVTNVTGNASTASTASDLSNAGIDAVLPDIDGFGLSINTGTTPDELQLAPGEVTGPQVWGDGSGTMSWTFNTGITDPIIDFYATGVVDVTGTLQMNTVPVVTETGSQTLTNKTLTTPTIASFTNATHNHTNAAGGGTLTLAGSAFPNQGTTTTVLHGNAAGNPSWGQVSNSDLAGSISVSKTLLTDGAGILLSTDTLSTASTEANFLANAASVTCSSSPGKLIVDTTAETLAYCDGAVGSTQKWAALGNDSGESTAAANNSVALTTDTTGNYAAGDAEAGNATGVACTDCIALTTETTGNYVATITGGAGIASTGAATGEGIGHTLSTASDEADFLKSGALTCGASTQGKMQVHTTPLQYCDNAGTPTLQYAAYGNSSGESTAAANNSVAMGTDTTGDYVATITGGTGITSSGATSGESIAHSLSFDATEIDSPTWSNGGSASLTHTWNLSGTDPVLTLQSGAFNLTGNTLIGATGSGGSLTVNSTSNATKGSIILDDKVDLWPNIPDFSASAMEVMEFNSDLDLSGVGLFHSIFHLDPTIHIGQAGGFLGGIVAVSTEGMLIAHDDATAASTNLPIPQLFWADHIIETTVAIAAPSDYVLLDQVEKRSTGAITVPTGGTHRTVWSAPKLKASTNATATYDEVSGLYWGPVAGTDFTTDGTALTVSEANAVKVANPTKDSGTGTTTYTEVNGLNCSNLTVATTNSCVKSAVTANSARYFLNDTGGAQSKLTGKFTTYNNVTTAGTGLPIITGESGVSATKTADFTALSYTPPATAGRYRVEQVITTTSGTNTGSFQCTVDYVDSQGTTHTADLMPMVNQTGLWATALPVVAGASKEWHCGPTYITINNSATAIVLKVDVTTGTVNYTVAASVEQLG